MKDSDLYTAVEHINLDDSYAHHEIVGPVTKELAADKEWFDEAFLDALCDFTPEQSEEFQRCIAKVVQYMDKDGDRHDAVYLAQNMNRLGAMVFSAWMRSCEAHVRKNAEDYLDDARRYRKELAA